MAGQLAPSAVNSKQRSAVMLKRSVLLGFLAASPVQAADSAGRFSAVGVGTAPCSMLTTSFEDTKTLAIFSAGFMAAVNSLLPGADHFPDYVTGVVFAGMIQAECERFPSYTVALAAARVWNEALKRGR